MNKEDKISILSGIVITGFVIAIVFHYVLGFYMGLKYPYNTFLLDSSVSFSDFTDLLPRIKDFAPYTPPGEWQNYFPLAYLIMAPFAYIKNKIFAYCIFVSIFLSFFTFANIKNLKCETFNKLQNFQNIFILTALTYPVLYAIDRGNFDMIIFIFFAVFVYFFQSKKYQASAIFLGIINALKPFSVLFLVLFLFEKKYKEFFLSIGTSFLLIIGGFMVFHGNIFEQISVMLQSFIWVQNNYILGSDGGMTNSSSLFMALKVMLCSHFNLISTIVLNQICGYVDLAIMLITIFFVWREKILWKRISLLTLCMFVASPAVFDYKLILLFIPLWLFVNSKEKSKFDFIYTFLFGLLLIPKRYIVLFITAKKVQLIMFSVLFNPLFILLFMGLIICEQFLPYKKEATING